MASYNDIITLPDGERINPVTFSNVIHVDDSKLSADRKSVACIAEYRKNFKTDKVNVPVAEIHVDPKDANRSVYHYSKEYVKHKERTSEDYDEMVEYDCDEEDYHWIELINAVRAKRKETPYTDEQFEFVMNRLEKESHFEVKGPAPVMSSMDTDDVCCICCDGEVNNANQIIYCDMCNIAVHQECYGVPYIPEGQWLCRRCKLSPSAPVSCCLCPNFGGAFKQTSDGRWAHVICAIWLNEVHFGNAVFLEPIEGVDNSLRRRSKLKCLVCRQKMGACLQCSTRSCLKAFHVTCAQQSGMSMRVEAKPDKNDPDGMDVQRYIYCHLHFDDDDSDPVVRKKRMQDAIRTARTNMHNSTLTTPTVNMPIISKEAVEGIAKRVGITIRDIVEYWYLKRKSRCGVPLIKRLQLSQKVSRVSIAHEEMDDEDRQLADRYRVLRHGLETGRLLCEQVKKREVHKRSHIKISREMLEKVFQSPTNMLDELLSDLSRKDKSDVFKNPVDVDGYNKTIKHPMDLSTMKKRLSDGKYHSLNDLKVDFKLMIDNCLKFNKNNEYYFNYGKKFNKSGQSIFEEFEKKEKSIEEIHSNVSMMEEITKIMFYEHVDLSSPDKTSSAAKEEEQDKRNIHPAALPSSPVRKEDNNQHKNIFLTPKTPSNGFDLRSGNKRKGSPKSLNPKSSKKSKNVDSTPPTMKQSTITRFFDSAGSNAERRATLREVPVPTPLMQYRTNVTSPLPTDIASSESSADEDDLRPYRRSARLGLVEHNKSELKDFGMDGFHHNKIVLVHGTVGRVIDPILASLDDQIPNPLLSECRLHPRKDQKICVISFGTENKWDYFSPSELESVNINDDCVEANPTSIRLARQWFKKFLDMYK